MHLFSTLALTLSLAAIDYPRPELLIEPLKLAESTSETKKAEFTNVILDARECKKYEEGCIPGALWVDHKEWSESFDNGADAEAWGKRIGKLGIKIDSHVVVYDDNFSKDAARIWWILRYWNVQHVAILNGGFHGWQSGKYKISKTKTEAATVEFKAERRGERLAVKKDVLGLLKTEGAQIVDARSTKEFCGTDKLTNKKGGSIPGAKHLEWIDLIEKDTHRFKKPDELKKLFADAKIDLDRPTTTYCQSGGRAAVMAFGLELMGAKDVRDYYKSWSEWGNADDTPIATPTIP